MSNPVAATPSKPAAVTSPIVTVDPVTGVCNPDPIVIVRETLGQNVEILFKIAGGENSEWKWSTTPPPIVVKAPAGIFSGGENPGGNGKGPVLVRDRNAPTDNGRYKYTATLINSSNETKVIDPEVVNEN